MAASDQRELLRALKKQGFVVEQTKRGHYRVYRSENPDDFVMIAATPSRASRAVKNEVAMLRRRLGFVWKGR